MTCEFVGRRPWAEAERKGAVDRPARTVHIVTRGTAFGIASARKKDL
jgi:hypothetical protein